MRAWPKSSDDREAFDAWWAREITKTSENRALVARERSRSNLRRGRAPSNPKKNGLTKVESRLLLELMQHPGEWIGNRVLALRLGYSTEGWGPRAVGAYVRRLKRLKKPVEFEATRSRYVG